MFQKWKHSRLTYNRFFLSGVVHTPPAQIKDILRIYMQYDYLENSFQERRSLWMLGNHAMLRQTCLTKYVPWMRECFSERLMASMNLLSALNPWCFATYFEINELDKKQRKRKSETSHHISFGYGEFRNHRKYDKFVSSFPKFYVFHQKHEFALHVYY